MNDQPIPISKRVLTPQERRQRNRDEMVTAILDAAREVMREEGVSALNLQEVARRVGLRAPSLYTYFPSKIAIYEALFEYGMRIYSERIEGLLATYGGTWDGLEQGLRNSMEFAQAYPELYQLVFERPIPGFVPSPAGSDEGRKLIELTHSAIRQLIDSGQAAPDLSIQQAVDMYIAMMQGLTAMHIANQPHVPITESRFGSIIPQAIAMLKAGWNAP